MATFIVTQNTERHEGFCGTIQAMDHEEALELLEESITAMGFEIKGRNGDAIFFVAAYSRRDLGKYEMHNIPLYPATKQTNIPTAVVSDHYVTIARAEKFGLALNQPTQ